MDLTKHGGTTFNKALFVLAISILGMLSVILRELHGEETGFKYFKNFSYVEYDHQPQNWEFVQNEKGIIYVANHGGVLVYDGVIWRVIYHPNMVVRSLAVNETGTVYVGGKDDIGYLAPDAAGELKYVSLLNHVPDHCKKFSNVWRTHAVKDGIYSWSSQYLFRWNNGTITVCKTDHPVAGTFVCLGNLYARLNGKGLARIKKDSFTLILGGDVFADKKIYMMVPYNNEKILIGTWPKGFYLYDGKKATSFPTEVDDYLQKNRLSHGIRLSSGDFAMATLLGGLVVMDARGKLKYLFDKSAGLQDDDVKCVFEDIQGNLWLGLNNGISRLEYGSPFFIYDNRSHLPGLVLSVNRHHSDLYVGTTKGLYVLSSFSKAFLPVHGISALCWDLVSYEDSLLAATSGGISQVKKNSKTHVISELSTFALLPSKHFPGRIWCGTDRGLVVLTREKGGWMVEHSYKTITRPVPYIVEDKNGGLWLGSDTGGLLKVEFPPGIRQPKVTSYNESHGLPGGRVYVAAAAGHIIFATLKGIFRFDEKKKLFIPDETLGPEFIDSSRFVFRLAEDKNGNIWFNSKSRNYLASPAPGGSFTVSRGPLRRIPTIQVNNIYPDPDGKTVWFASHDGLIRCDTTIKKNYRQDYRTLVRKVSINKKVIFNGYKNKTSNTAEELIPVIRYYDRNLRFDFAATFLEAETRTLYRCLLEGYDDGWSSWDKETIKAYTNLSPGFYTFRVQSRNVYHHIGAEDRFRFRILPPWYMTWWAYCLYALGIILVIYGIVKWRSFKLVLEKQNLENIIKKRMKEIKQKNQQLEIQSNQLQEMAKVKSHFFANISHEFRTPLTLIMNPLEQMLTDSRSKKQKKMFKSMLQNSQRLLTLINQLLDLSRFDSGKTKLQAAFQNIVPFIRGILASFQMLAHQNQLSLDFHAEKQEITLYYDTQKMEEVMYNLLINAIKFTPPGGKITVSISLACGEGEEQHPSPAEETVGPGFVEISVRDTGVGISTEQLDHIFDRFYQAESRRDIKGHKGTGIGLALTREMVLLHRGRIDVHSREGKGSEFVIRLPLGQSHLESHEVKLRSQTVTFGKKEKEIQLLYMTEESEVEDETTVESSLDENGENGAETGADAGGAHEKKSDKQEKNVILVVEDNADVRKYIREPLEKNYKVVEAGDGKEGIEKAKKIIPDLIVSDIMMPEPDGIELCKVLKKDIETSHIPIILLTAKASEESIIRGLKTGADDYITKPFKTRILLARIKNLIYLRRQMQLKIQRRKLLLPAEISISSADEKFLKEFQEIVEKNFTDPEFNVDMLCKKICMGRATIFRKTQALTGETPNQYILSCRLERGAQLLENNYGNVTEVALAVGFYNPSYFSKCFKEKFHRSPSSFKTSESQSPSK